jgi:acetyl-CoA acyltransferase
MTEAVIIDAVRTPGGRRNGMLAGWHPADLSALVLQELTRRNDLDPGLVEDVVWGCVSQAGEQSGNIGRYAALSAGFPEHVPGTTIQRQCGSSQQAMHFAAQGVIAGAYDVVIAGGVESMTRVPMGSSSANGPGAPAGRMLQERYEAAGGLVPQGIAAEKIAAAWKLSREEMDAYSVRSHQRAARATAERHFQREIVPVPVTTDAGVVSFTSDEGIRPGSTVETLAGLKPAFTEGGQVTAGNSSQITDASSAMLIMSGTRAEQLGLRPRARFHGFAVVGSDPLMMLTGPIPATRKVLERAGLTLDDMDVIEINEAFASVVLAFDAELHPDPERLNPNGGAIALGHPLGATGTKLAATLLGEVERRGGRYGLVTMCEGGGMANATIIERLG